MAARRAAEATQGGESYLELTRSLSVSLVSILPLIVIYHVGIVQSGYPTRNLAEVWIEGPLTLVGLQAAHVLNVALIAALFVLLLRSDLKATAWLPVCLVMIVEGGLYALALYRGGSALSGALYERAHQVFFAVRFLPGPRLLLALGAGVYEELFFRLMLLGGLAWVLRRFFRWDGASSVGLAMGVSSLLFAAAHHVGPMGERFVAYNFLFRTICGLLLGVVYVFRGFGIAVWAHAIYNAVVVVSTGGV